jgi:hypothetical protein
VEIQEEQNITQELNDNRMIIIQWYNDKNRNKHNNHIPKYIYELLEKETKFLNKNSKYKERIYYVTNNLFEYVKCKYCNNIVKFSTSKICKVCNDEVCKHKLNQSKFAGKTHSKETKQKISNSHLKIEPWNKGRTNVYTEEQLKRMSDVKIGKIFSDNHKYNLSLSHIDKILTEEHKNNIKLAAKDNPNFGMRGKTLSYESRKKISKKNKGKKRTPEQKLKMSQSLSGENNGFFGKTHTEKTRKNISNAHRGKKKKPLSTETRNKISQSLSGKNHSEETKQKMRETKLKQVMIDGQWCTVGKNEKQILDEQEIKHNCKIDRNFQIIGYKPDGYCHETNTIYEVYEKFHDKYVQEDLERENRICNKLGCDFIIIYDRTH